MSRICLLALPRARQPGVHRSERETARAR